MRIHEKKYQEERRRAFHDGVSACLCCVADQGEGDAAGGDVEVIQFQRPCYLLAQIPKLLT